MAQAITDSVIPLDAYVLKEWYAGYEQRAGDAHYFDLMRPFQKSDENEFWFHENAHYSRGVIPFSHDLVEDIFVWGTQGAAAILALPTSHGIKGRYAGTHPYGAQAMVASDWEIGFRAARFGAMLGPFLQNFNKIWAGYEHELMSNFQRFVDLDMPSMGYDELRTTLTEGYAYHQRSYGIHMEVMYALLANYLGFYQLNQEFGLDPAKAATFLVGDKTKFMEADEELGKLAKRARELGVDGILLADDLGSIQKNLDQSANGRVWLKDFQAFLNVYGWRVDEAGAGELEPWIDDPRPALGTVRTLLGKSDLHNFESSYASMVAERDQAIEEARSKLGGGSKLQQWNDALISCQKANFSWWNDEHNFYIDQRTQIPVHRAAKALGQRLAADGHLAQPDDIWFLFGYEVRRALAGDADWKTFRPFVSDRRDFYNYWLAKAGDMPNLMGTVPEAVGDPIMLEIFGLYPHFLDAVKHAATDTSELRGMPASGGVAEGPARVLHHSSEIYQIKADEILVCSYTTPDWTPVFGAIKGCVCDGGGSLAHAAIVSREYGLPCVVGTANATRVIKTGDRIKVDGDRGVVTIYK